MSKAILEETDAQLREFLASRRRKEWEEGREQGLEEGRRKGMELGRRRALRTSLLRVLESRFGAIPDDLGRGVAVLDSADRLDDLFGQALTINSLDQLSL